MKDHKVFVVSLPRTGTTSMCKMLNDLGYKAKHVPSCFYEKWAAEGFNAFADTPCFAPTFVKEHSLLNPKNKFIFIEKDFGEWIKSFESVKLDRSYNILLNQRDPTKLNVVSINEIKAYGEVFGFGGVYTQSLFLERAMQHAENIKEMLSSDQFLSYNFQMGWTPLCDFLNTPIPNAPLPVLNFKGKIGENYENKPTPQG